MRVVVVGALLLSACSTELPPTTTAAGGPGSYRVLLTTGASPTAGVDVIHTASKEVMSLPSGTLSADGTRLFVTRVVAGAPTLRTLDPRTGELLAEKAIAPGNFEAPGIISSNGRWLVRSYHPGDGVPSTNIAVFDTRNLSEHDITLHSLFELDAISDTGGILYLLETVGPLRYRVRDYDLANDTLEAKVIVDKADASPVMTGTRVGVVSSTDGRQVFGLYHRPGKAPFVHVLWVTEKLAWCVDLPATAGLMSDSAGWSLLLDEGRSLLFVTNSAGIISQVDVSNLPRLMRTESFVPPAATASFRPPWVDAAAKEYADGLTSGRAALSVDGKTLFIPDGSGYMTVGSDSLHPTGRKQSGNRLTSVALSPDGRRLFAVVPTSNLLLELDANSGQEIARFTIPHPVGILRVIAA